MSLRHDVTLPSINNIEKDPKDTNIRLFSVSLGSF